MLLPIRLQPNLASAYPSPSPMLEEAAGVTVGDQPAAFAFALSRMAGSKPVLAVLPQHWLGEYGRPFPHGFADFAPVLLLIRPRTAVDALWTMEQGLRSGAVAGVVGAIETTTLTQTRRLDFAAREGGSVAVLLRGRGGGLSAARRRWQIAAYPSAVHPFDARAPGLCRLRAELVRRHDGPPGVWILEQDHATDHLRLVASLADNGLAAGSRTLAAA